MTSIVWRPRDVVGHVTHVTIPTVDGIAIDGPLIVADVAPSISEYIYMTSYSQQM